jgi:hypothetical protein
MAGVINAIKNPEVFKKLNTGLQNRDLTKVEAISGGTAIARRHRILVLVLYG